ncbi:MAG: helix-turn-helix domain-containing protein [Dysgonomonas sp.]|nr:helix-turn-helix domain-containing protein [Dysgonomonas sp.]
MQEKNDIFLNKLKNDQFIEIFKLEDLTDETIFGNYQRYDFFQLLWFTEVKGNPVYFLDFKEYKIEKDQIVLVFPGQIDRLDIEGKKGFLFAIHNDVFFRINQRMNSGYLNGYFSNVFISLNDELKHTLKLLLGLILSEYNTKNRLLLMESYMESFLFHIASVFEETEAYKSTVDSQVSELMWLIDSNFISEHETDFYARKLGTTNRRVNEICKAGTGKTVKQHLQERLILEIKKEIRMKEKSLKEIAFDLGFSEPAYFTRFFKLHTSMTPTEFRDMQ